MCSTSYFDQSNIINKLTNQILFSGNLQKKLDLLIKADRTDWECCYVISVVYFALDFD